jgi:hypothetical protein
MVHVANSQPHSLRKAPKPPLSYPGATPESDRAKKPRLSEPAPSDQPLDAGDHVEGLGDFGRPMGEFGTVEQSNEDDAVVKWDNGGRVRFHQSSLKKVEPKVEPHYPAAPILQHECLWEWFAVTEFCLNNS